ncbi:proline permease PUT4 [Kluyveromyces lactis]|uniref:KLLA0F23419p n=1 Tax=Kluyveromyces lactis (strain ATCC 8585 / CBS 2359 / DSM 70799 / NBRC 1267 / NRRL Y-1140 / WM37) TaxID=284590 RepID=Q6CIW6_KLULA|nr:uncharacterized protein KLLA0_F23419g [Kluyveromyces lactis]CAG98831.1 KLLA0F23419p [Kluyveromyces lactis]|eukprot:XP_456123.1 uncharacterized protein KLLA0_F23419g [Kluyveromyces lactis]
MSNLQDLKDAGETSVVDKQTGQVYELDLTSYSNDSEKNGSLPNKPQSGDHNLKKGLKSAHIQLIAIGGCIGTGLFVGTSSTLYKCGPAGLFISYCIMSTIIYPVMNALAEMVCFLPGLPDENETGGSISTLCTRYVDSSLGFAVGWNYVYCYVILVAAECTAASGVVTYWTTAVPKAAWITIFLGIIVVLNCTAVEFYGTSEAIFCSLKIFCILGIIIVSIVLFFGGGPNHDRLGFRFWKDPGAWAYHLADGGAGRLSDIITGVIRAGFAFILGPELVVLTSTEAQDSRRNIEKAARRFVWRLIFFYCVSSLCAGVIVSRNDPVLLNALSQGKPGAGSSPFVIGIQNAGIKVLPHIINVCILSSAWSSGNSFMYATTRSLLSLSQEGYAPKIFNRVNRWGVPYTGVAFATAFSCLAYLNVSSSTADVFNWFSNISTISGFLGWICSGVAYLRFRKAVFFNNLYDRLPFKTPFQPYFTWFYIILIAIICLINGYESFVHWNYKDFIAAYITLPLFLILWLGHKAYTRTWSQWMISVSEIDVTTGLREIEEETKELNARRIPPRNLWEKILEWLF